MPVPQLVFTCQAPRVVGVRAYGPMMASRAAPATTGAADPELIGAGAAEESVSCPSFGVPSRASVPPVVRSARCRAGPIGVVNG